MSIWRPGCSIQSYLVLFPLRHHFHLLEGIRHNSIVCFQNSMALASTYCWPPWSFASRRAGMVQRGAVCYSAPPEVVASWLGV